MKIDARTRYTKKIIKETFIRLLNENSLNKVTVKKLCDEAEINRATFYRYYDDVYDLYEKTKEEFIEVFFRTFGDKELFSVKEDLVNFLNLIKENSHSVYALSRQSDVYDLMRILCEKIYNRFDERFKKNCSELTERERQGVYYYVVCGSTGIIAEWIERGMESDEQEIAELLTKLITNTLADL